MLLLNKMMLPFAVLFLLNLAELHGQAAGQAALFYKNKVLDPQRHVQENQQVARQARQSQTDITVKNILEWLQGRSNKDKQIKALGRQARDNGDSGAPDRTYLPAEGPEDTPIQTTARPRPFQTNPTTTTEPPPQVAPNSYLYQPPPSPAFPNPAPYPGAFPGSTYTSLPAPQLPPDGSPYQPAPSPAVPNPSPYPSLPASQLPPDGSAYLPPASPAIPNPVPYPGTLTADTNPSLPTSQLPPDGSPYLPPASPAVPNPAPYPSTLPADTNPSLPVTQLPPISDTGSDGDVVPSGDNRPPGSDTVIPSENELHPPHIHNIEVQCAKDNMAISIEFDRVFNGIIYSKGFYKQNACRYVNENSGQKLYTINVRLDSCGTQFVDQLQEGGQAYLENVLVLQNEVGIQEVWDTVRSVRCLWEGNINKALSVELNVDMLQQEIVTFSGDTAVATLDIQMGRGPFAPKATGLVKIGETMTLVVSVEGDPGFDIAVHDCIARDSTGANVVQLTDERGCVLRPKLMGAFQKTRDTANTQASVIAYAYFQAFKFPDVMDLTMECNVELCKTDCQTCPEIGQSPDPLVRRRRDLYVDNSTLGDPVKIHRSFWVVSPDDVQDPKSATVINLGSSNEGICMSVPGFMLTSMLLLSVLIASSVLCAYLWLKKEPKHLVARTIQLDSFPASKA